MKPRWQKVFRDLWLNKTRTLLVILSIAVGVFAVGMITNSQIVLSTTLVDMYVATNPAHATVITITPFDEDLVEAVRNMEAVAEAEARHSVTLRVKTGPDEWKNLGLVAISDFNDIRVAKFGPDQGAWPPPKREILVERSTLGTINAAVGDYVTVKTPLGKERQIRIAGTSYDLQGGLLVLAGEGPGHISMDTLEWLGESRNFNELYVRVAENENDRDHIKAVMNEVQDKIEESGRIVAFVFIPEPNQPPLNYLVQAILGILGAIGVLALVLSVFLVVNTISAILTQQAQQIGIMKAIGARAGQIVALYMVMALLFGVFALIIAMPLAVVSSFFFTRMIAAFLGFEVNTFQIVPLALGLQIGIALLVPLLAGIFPILAGTRVTVQQAISSQGLGRDIFGSSIIDRLLTGSAGRTLLGWFSRPTLISINNTFRRKKRLLLTLATLVMGGAIFIVVSSIQASLSSTLDTWLEYYQYDVTLQMGRPYRIKRIERAVMEVPGVVDVEGWGSYTARRLRPDGTDSGNIMLVAPPANTKTIRPTLLRGRWLLPEDKNAIVLNTIALRYETDVDVGDDIILKIDGKEVKWRVVGIAQGGSLIATAFMNQEALALAVGQVGKSELIAVVTDQHDPDYQARISQAVADHLTAAGYRISLTQTASQEKQIVENLFRIIFVLLLVMALILAMVGGLGLMGTMSINVLERTREIGVMRAVGASNGAILKIVLFEGMFIGIISWIVGAALALPISKALSDTIGTQLLSSSLSYTFSINGTISWFILVIVLAAVAGFLPAWNAVHLTVREVLAYE